MSVYEMSYKVTETIVCVCVCVCVYGCAFVCLRTTQCNWQLFSGVICPSGPRHGSVSSSSSLSPPLHPPSLSPSFSPPPSVFLCFCVSWQSSERCDLLPLKDRDSRDLKKRLDSLSNASPAYCLEAPSGDKLSSRHTFFKNMLTCLYKCTHK